MKNNLFFDRIEKYLSAGIFPGCEFALIDGQQIKDFRMGNASLFPEKRTLAAGELWDLASVSKVVGVGTIMIDQVFAGKIELDRSLKSYYPDWHEDTVTVRRLLTHTSGVNPFIENRDKLSFPELHWAMEHLKVEDKHEFYYTDVNFILLGFLLEYQFGLSLAKIDDQLFKKFMMPYTSYGPVKQAVPTSVDRPAGLVHDPKARVLGVHCGSAGLFSNLADLENFVQAYMADEKYLQLYSNFSENPEKPRSLAWAMLNPDWLIHTGYTGTFIMMNLKKKQAVIFLSNRVYLRDNRQQWIQDRDLLIQDFLKYF